MEGGVTEIPLKRERKLDFASAVAKLSLQRIPTVTLTSHRNTLEESSTHRAVSTAPSVAAGGPRKDLRGKESLSTKPE